MALQNLSAPSRASSRVHAGTAQSGVVHVKVRHAAHYTVIGNHLVQHRSLSLVAIGLAAYIQSLPTGARIGIKRLTERFREGETRISGALRELEAHGYLERSRVRLPDGRVITRTVSFNRPSARGGRPWSRSPSRSPWPRPSWNRDRARNRSGWLRPSPRPCPTRVRCPSRRPHGGPTRSPSLSPSPTRSPGPTRSRRLRPHPRRPRTRARGPRWLPSRGRSLRPRRAPYSRRRHRCGRPRSCSRGCAGTIPGCCSRSATCGSWRPGSPSGWSGGGAGSRTPRTVLGAAQ